MQSLAILGLCILSAVAYGVLHDLVTIRVCPEYFTIGHPPIHLFDSLTQLAFFWGIAATWWVGLLLGLPLALAARGGLRPKRTALSLVRPVAVLLGIMAACALAAGVLGWVLASNGAVGLVGPMETAVPRDKHVAFLAALWAHSASYLVGVLGGGVLIVQVWRSRNRLLGATTGPVVRS